MSEAGWVGRRWPVSHGDRLPTVLTVPGWTSRAVSLESEAGRALSTEERPPEGAQALSFDTGD
jgi:hypothetical protein